MDLHFRHVARNVLFNWFGTLVSMAAGFFLSPFILHRLGDVAVGVWMVAVSAVGYLGLLDLGMQSAVLRFISKGRTQGDHESASDALSAALWVRLQISALVLLLSVLLAVAFPYICKVDATLASDARTAVMIIGLTTAVTMSLGVFGAVLSGLNRYDLRNMVTLFQTAIRITCIVIALRTGHGIVSIALSELAAVILGNILLVIVAIRLYPELQIRLNRPSQHTLKRIWTYSAYAFLTTIAVKLVYQTDNLVIGAFVSVAAVTPYAYANALCRYVDQVVSAMGLTFVPAASTYEALGDSGRLEMLYKNGTRATLAICLPIVITLVVRGRSFMGLWMGPQYAKTSGTVLIILVTAMLFSFANRTAAAIAFGIEKHKTSAIWAIGEGVANLVLSVILARKYGILGVAVGTALPSLFVQIILWPGYVSRLVGLSYSDVLGRVWLPVFLAATPFAGVSYAVERLLPARNLAIFFLQIVVTLPVFLLSIGLVFRGYVRTNVLPKVRAYLVQG